MTDFKDFNTLEDVCLLRGGVEAVLKLPPEEHFKSASDKILACSVAAIPLVHGCDSADGVPLAAVFSWKEKGKLCTRNFHLGDILTQSARRRNFQALVSAGAFDGFHIVAIDKQAENFIGHFGGELEHRGSDGLDWKILPISGCYYNPAMSGHSREEKAAMFGLPAPPPAPLNISRFLDLACRIWEEPSLRKVKDSPTLTGTFEQLAWRNQAVFGLADKIAQRCEAVQKLTGGIAFGSQLQLPARRD